MIALQDSPTIFNTLFFGHLPQQVLTREAVSGFSKNTLQLLVSLLRRNIQFHPRQKYYYETGPIENMYRSPYPPIYSPSRQSEASDTFFS
jgi:predicted lipase